MDVSILLCYSISIYQYQKNGGVTISNDVVRYNNGFNTVPLRQFTPVEMDIFWAVCSKMKRKGTQELTFHFDTFKELSNYKRESMESFYNAIKAFSEKLGTLTYKFENEDEFEQLWLFQRFHVRKKEETITIQVSDRFEFILNSIGSNFTRFELETLTNLSSGYTKELYRQLMAHRDLKTRKGAWFVTVENFKEILSIPKSYQMTNIDTRILDKAEKEFTTPNTNGKVIFSSFKIEKVKARKGNKIASFRIYFQEPKPIVIV